LQIRISKRKAIISERIVVIDGLYMIIAGPDSIVSGPDSIIYIHEAMMSIVETTISTTQTDFPKGDTVLSAYPTSFLAAEVISSRYSLSCAVVLSAARSSAQQTSNHHIKTVIILMENKNWFMIKDNPLAPYINGALLPNASHTEVYFNPPFNHPSLPNYLWLEAGTNFGIYNDGPPSVNHQSNVPPASPSTW